MSANPGEPIGANSQGTMRPPHVPASVVRDYPFISGATTTQRPHSLLAKVHEGPEIFWADRVVRGARGAWVPRTIELFRQIYNDEEHFSTHAMAPYPGLIGESWAILPMEADGVYHTLLRSMLNPALMPKTIAPLEGKIRHHAQQHIRRIKAKGACEFIADFALEFPVQIFLELMGLPLDRLAEFRQWEHKLMFAEDVDQIREATLQVSTYLREQISDRRSTPRNDLITLVAQAEKDGRKLADDEQLGVCMNLFLGGLDTVSANMSWVFLHLAENAEHQRLLRANPAMIPDAIDEIIRARGSVATYRECVKEIAIGDITMMPGDKIVMATYLANHDPQAFPSPDTVVLDRAPRAVNFGFGPHTCIGMHLARRELRIALEEFLAEIPQFRLPENVEIDFYLAGSLQPMALPLVWTP